VQTMRFITEALLEHWGAEPHMYKIAILVILIHIRLLVSTAHVLAKDMCSEPRHSTPQPLTGSRCRGRGFVLCG
jgi:hypothetical protein